MPMNACFQLKVSKFKGVAKYWPKPTIAQVVGTLLSGISYGGQSG